MSKRETSKERIRGLLSDGQPHHMRELNAISFRYGGRLHELRHDEGLNIVTRRIAEDEFEYQLVIENRQLSLIG